MVDCNFAVELPNGLRYLRWGGDGEAVQPEKGEGVENCLGCAQNPQRQVHALLGAVELEDSSIGKDTILWLHLIIISAIFI